MFVRVSTSSKRVWRKEWRRGGKDVWGDSSGDIKGGKPIDSAVGIKGSTWNSDQS